MQVCKTRAIGLNGEHRAIARTAAWRRRAIQGIARQYQSGLRRSSVAAAGKIIQVRENLRGHPAGRYQAETGYQREPGEQNLNAGFHSPGIESEGELLWNAAVVGLLWLPTVLLFCFLPFELF